MSYKIISSKEFERDFKKLDSNFQKRIKKKMNEVADNPTRYKHLHPPLQNYCRIWIGKFRIVFSYNVEKKILYLERIVFDHKY
jgi:mRNA-degrading endonuclease RelE of RelBE toxin-antitoxin system